MPTDSTRNNIVEKILGLHYNDFQNSAPCIDSAFTSIGSQKSPIIGSSWESRANPPHHAQERAGGGNQAGLVARSRLCPSARGLPDEEIVRTCGASLGHWGGAATPPTPRGVGSVDLCSPQGRGGGGGGPVICSELAAPPPTLTLPTTRKSARGEGIRPSLLRARGFALPPVGYRMKRSCARAAHRWGTEVQPPTLPPVGGEGRPLQPAGPRRSGWGG